MTVDFQLILASNDNPCVVDMLVDWFNFSTCFLFPIDIKETNDLEVFYSSLVHICFLSVDVFIVLLLLELGPLIQCPFLFAWNGAYAVFIVKVSQLNKTYLPFVRILSSPFKADCLEFLYSFVGNKCRFSSLKFFVMTPLARYPTIKFFILPGIRDIGVAMISFEFLQLGKMILPCSV